MEIPKGTTHSVKLPIFNNRTQRRFYNVRGGGNVVRIWFNGQWLLIDEYEQQLKDRRISTVAVKTPDFNAPYVERHEQNADDKLRELSDRLSAEGVV